MVKLAFIGDIGLNDDYIHLKSKGVDPFRNLTPYLKDADLVIGNLECVLKGDQGENLLKRPRVSTTIDTLQYLKSINLGLVSLATNHVYDNLTDGFQKTVTFLNSQNIASLGAGIDKNVAESNYSVTIQGISFCFFNYITPDTHPSLPVNSGMFINEFNEEKCIADLKTAFSYDYRIVLMHWGGRFEGGLYPDFNQIALGQKLIDNGADLIIGHHSHTLQPHDTYKGRKIFYSLGNFCFANIWFEGKIRGMSSVRERESLIVNVEFSKSGYKVSFIPFRNENLFLVKRRIVGYKYFFRKVIWSLLKNRNTWRIYDWYFHNIKPILVQLQRKDQNRSLYFRIFNRLREKMKG